MRAHLQMIIWIHALDAIPLDLAPTSSGWSNDDNFTSLAPVTVPEGVTLVLDELLKMIRCSCKSNIPCKSGRCSCTGYNLPCSVFCVCQGGLQCHNVKHSELIDADDIVD